MEIYVVNTLETKPLPAFIVTVLKMVESVLTIEYRN